MRYFYEFDNIYALIFRKLTGKKSHSLKAILSHSLFTRASCVNLLIAPSRSVGHNFASPSYAPIAPSGGENKNYT